MFPSTLLFRSLHQPTMPVRQMSCSDQTLVVKTPKTTQNVGKSQLAQDYQTEKLHHPKPPLPVSAEKKKNRGRRKRGVRKPRHVQPTDCHEVLHQIRSSGTDGGGADDVGMETMSFPNSNKSITFAGRPGFGQTGTKCVVKANHFFTQLPDKDLNQYNVITHLKIRR